MRNEVRLMEKTYIAIDLKSFYASCECIYRNLDPLNVNLVVADESRTNKTICLAVSPPLKSYGIPGRPRLFEVIKKVKEINRIRIKNCENGRFSGKSFFKSELIANPCYELDYIIAPPQMALYIDTSTKIYDIYLKYVSKDDIHIYSVDEVFMDVTSYLSAYRMSPRDLAMMIIEDVLSETGITATVGIGTNLFLCKVAMDIVAKHIEPDEHGVRIAYLDEKSYRKLLWEHMPLTDFWMLGRGYQTKLEANGMFTMGDIALCSEKNEELLFKLFGVNAGLLIDHAWGVESCTIKDIKNYVPAENSSSISQVLQRPYSFDEATVIVREMAASLALDLTKKKLVTNQITLTIGYDTVNSENYGTVQNYIGETKKDFYSRATPKHSHGSENINIHSSSVSLISSSALKLFSRIVNRNLTVRRINITACKIIPVNMIPCEKSEEQLDFFTDYDKINDEKIRRERFMTREADMQMSIIKIKEKYGKNSLLYGSSYLECATARERNIQIGGHRA